MTEPTNPTYKVKKKFWEGAWHEVDTQEGVEQIGKKVARPSDDEIAYWKALESAAITDGPAVPTQARKANKTSESAPSAPSASAPVRPSILVISGLAGGGFGAALGPRGMVGALVGIAILLVGIVLFLRMQGNLVAKVTVSMAGVGLLLAGIVGWRVDVRESREQRAQVNAVADYEARLAKERQQGASAIDAFPREQDAARPLDLAKTCLKAVTWSLTEEQKKRCTVAFVTSAESWRVDNPEGWASEEFSGYLDGAERAGGVTDRTRALRAWRDGGKAYLEARSQLGTAERELKEGNPTRAASAAGEAQSQLELANRLLGTNPSRAVLGSQIAKAAGSAAQQVRAQERATAAENAAAERQFGRCRAIAERVRGPMKACIARNCPRETGQVALEVCFDGCIASVADSVYGASAKNVDTLLCFENHRREMVLATLGAN